MNALRRGAEDRERNLLGDLMEGRLESASAVDSRTGHVNLFQVSCCCCCFFFFFTKKMISLKYLKFNFKFESTLACLSMVGIRLVTVFKAHQKISNALMNTGAEK